MTRKVYAGLLAMLLALALLYLPVAAAPSQDEMDGMTPYGLAAEAIPGENGATLLTFQVVGLGADLPGMEPDDDIHVVLEYKRGAGEWNEYNRYGSKTMLDSQTDAGEYTCRFDWVFDTAWDGEEPVFFRAYCEYMQYGVMGTGFRSDISNVAVIGIEQEDVTEPTTIEIVPIPYDETDLEQPQESSGALAISLAFLLWTGGGLSLLLIIVILLIIVTRRKRGNRP